MIAAFNSMRLFTEKIAATASSGIAKVRILIGTFIGFLSVAKMAPFAISIATGVYKGSILFKRIVENSHAFDDTGDGRNDAEKIKLFTGLIIFLTGSVTAVPIVTVTIFFYQAYADQYFVMFVLGIEIFVVLKMMKGLMNEK